MKKRRLRPRSLFWRISLVLGGGAVLIQILSTLYVIAFGGPFLFHSLALPAARIIATDIRLLNDTGSAGRDRLLSLLADESIAVRLASAPPPLPPLLPDEEEKLTEIFQAHLRQILPQGTAFVAQVEGMYRGLPESMVTRLLPFLGRRPNRLYDFSYTVGARLADGSWAVFSHSVPASQRRILPYPMMSIDLGVRIIGITLLVLVVVRWIIRPLSVLARAADELGQDINRPPLPETGPQEIVQASQAFNRMQQRIRTFVDERERMIAAVSHDLKTPITRLRLRCDLVGDPALREQLVADLEEMNQLLATSIDFIRSSHSGEGWAEVDVTALLESLADDYAEMGHPITVRGAAGAPLRAQPLHLKRCLTNLIDNAVRYGSRVSITVLDQPALLSIVIEDNGPGIPGELIEKVFEPFFRVESSRSRATGGSGLGLSIARNVARLHGGDVTLANRPQGGLETRLTLPRP